MKKLLNIFFWLFVFATISRAEITTVALYHCGDDGDDPTNCLIAAVGTNATLIYNNGSASIQNGGPRGGMYLQTSKMVWSPGFAYLDGQSYNWGIAAWVKMPSGPLPGGQYTGDSLYYFSNGGYANGLSLNYGNANTSYWNHSSNVAEVDPALWDTWAHVALVFNGSNKKQLYVNGVKIGSDTAANADWGTSGLYRYFYIGTRNYNNYSGRFAQPAIDEVRVFSFAEGAFQISDIYQSIWWSNIGTTNIMDTSAQAYGTLVVDGASNAVATLYWATNDLGKVHAGWMGTKSLGTISTGLVSNVAMTGLRGVRTYYYRFYATNSVMNISGWSDSGSFITAPPPAGTVLMIR